MTHPTLPAPSPRAAELYDRMLAFMRDHVLPAEEEYTAQRRAAGPDDHELPGVVDELITLAELRTEKGQPYRAFICTTLNPFGFPAKDRSGRLATIEEPHLGRLMEKIRQPAAAPPPTTFQVALPAAEPMPNTPTTQEG